MSKLRGDFSNYQAVDFVLDETFVAWVKHPTPELDAFWKQWLLDHPLQQPAIQEAIHLVSHLTTNPYPIEPEAIEHLWEQLSAAHDAQASVKATPAKTSFLWPYWRGIAAAAVLLVGLAGWWQWNLRKAPVRTMVFSTPYGTTQHLWLPDSSEVFLNANSRLTYQNDWSSDKAREVWIEGEAYCKVRQLKDDDGNPQRFIAHTRNVQVAVLGTEFNVIHRRGNSVVVLNSGKVRLTNQDNQHRQEILMKPGELAAYSDTQQVFLTRIVNPNFYSAWIKHKLIFNQTTLAEIAQLLNNNYGMTVVFKQSRLSAKKFTATIPSNDLNVLLTALQESFNVKIEKHNSQLIFSEKR